MKRFLFLRFDTIEDDGSIASDDGQMLKVEGCFPIKGEVIVASPISVTSLCETICHDLTARKSFKTIP